MKTLLTTFLVLIACTVYAQTLKATFSADTAKAIISSGETIIVSTVPDLPVTDADALTGTDNQHLRNTLSLMYNYKINQIETIDLRHFCLSDVQVYLKQTERALLAYTWMRKNRPQYSILKCVRLVNAWHRR